MRPIVCVVAMCLGLAACVSDECNGDPVAPGANTTISLGAAVDPGAYQTLELRGFPEATDAFDGTIPSMPGDLVSQSVPLVGIAFPYEYSVGGAMGVTELPRYRVVAWLSQVSGSAAPEPGNPQGTVSVALPECPTSCFEDKYCGVVDGVDLVLAVQP